MGSQVEMHSAEWLRGAIHVADANQLKTTKAYWEKLLTEAEAREAAIARATQLHDTYPHTEEPSLADQLAEAQAEVARLSARVDALEDSMNPQEVQTVDAGIAARDAHMKALGAAEVWEIVAERSKLVGDSAGEQYARAEAARLAEGE